MPASSRLVQGTGLALCIALLTACGAPDPNANLPERLKKMAPTETPTATFTHSAANRIDSRTVRGDGWSILIPASLEEQTGKATNGTTIYRWIAPTPGAQPPVVGVVVDIKPKADAIEQSKLVEINKEIDGTIEVQRSQIVWPGAERAVLLQWDQPGQGGEEATNWQLMVQVDSDLILNVFASAPKDRFVELKFADIVSTFTPAV